MDMDGVLVHEEHAIPGADRLPRRGSATAGTPFLVLTNNSIYTPRDLAARLRASGLEVPEERDLDLGAGHGASSSRSSAPAARRSSSARRA